MYINGGIVRIHSTTIASNEAQESGASGGAIYMKGQSTVSIIHSLIITKLGGDQFCHKHHCFSQNNSV